ncbi:MAG: bile acid:sodium symporter family protein [Thiotrichales bacterium]|nr:bile acid:sodium symporter family protein [Thiotrichales bacterium]
MTLHWAIIPLLGVIMFGMGVTLSVQDFKRVLQRPMSIALGLCLQFLLMPLLAWLISSGLQLSLPLMAGMILVGACPGGTASNVICYLARGDVALSITMTSVSTFLAILLTPLLTWLYLGERIPVPVQAMMISIFKIIIIPVALGVLVNHLLGQRFRLLKKSLPLVSMAAIVFIIGIIVALNHEKLHFLLFSVLLAVMLHNLAGLLLGYQVSKWLGCDVMTCKTIAIEVGMQNSGLGVALASKYFVAAAALPGAIFSIWHNITGAILASVWSKKETKQ